MIIHKWSASDVECLLLHVYCYKSFSFRVVHKSLHRFYIRCLSSVRIYILISKYPIDPSSCDVMYKRHDNYTWIKFEHFIKEDLDVRFSKVWLPLKKALFQKPNYECDFICLWYTNYLNKRKNANLSGAHKFHLKIWAQWVFHTHKLGKLIIIVSKYSKMYQHNPRDVYQI